MNNTIRRPVDTAFLLNWDSEYNVEYRIPPDGNSIG